MHIFSYLLPHRWRKRLNSIQRLFLNVIIAATLLVFGVWIYTSFINPEQTKAAWFDSRWLYRQIATISNSSGSTLSDYQVQITLNTSSLISTGKMRSDCGDLRITNGKGVLLPYWIETGANGCNTSTTSIWTKVPSIATSNSDAYIYYGNSQATSVQNGDQVFEFFDDFSTNSLGQKWSGDTSQFSISAGYLSPTNNNYRITSAKSFTGNYEVISRVNTTTGPVNGYQVTGFFGSNTNSYGVLNHGSGTNWYTRNDSSWHGPISFTWTQWVRAQAKVVGTAGSAALTGETSGTSSLTDTNSGLSGETVSLGRRYDNTNYNQTIDADWDWIMVKKAVTTEPTVSLGSEEQSPGPIAYWGMDEGSGTTVHDGTTIGNNGTIHSATWARTSDCKVGKCLYFNGTNAYVDFGNVSTTASMAGDLTISFWIKPTNIAKGRQNPIGKAYGGEFDFTLETSGALSYYHGSAGTDGNPYTSFVTSSNALKQSQWQHVVLTRDTATRTLKYYLNGTLIKTATYSSTYDPVKGIRSLKFGYEYAGYFQGYLDEVLIFNTAKSASDIKSLYSSGNAGSTAYKGSSSVLGSSDKSTLNNGLVGYWKMDETSYNGTSGEVSDSSGTNNDGTTNNGVLASTSAKFGNSGGFDGVDDYVSIPDNTSLNPTSGISISAWVKGGSWGANNNILSKPVSTSWSSPYGTYDLEIQNSGTKIDFLLDIGGSPKQQFSTVSLTTGTWYHIVTTYDGSTQRTYLNGVQIASTAQTGSIATSTQPLAIGTRSTTSPAQYFDGDIDETRIYNRALTPTEVQQLYNYAPGPVAYYDFNQGTGTTLSDKSGNGNDSTAFSGAPQWTQGKYGGGMYFDGSSYVRINHAITSTADNTISFWLKSPVQPNNYNRILADNTNGISVYFTGTGTNGLYGSIGDSTAGWVMSSPNIADNEWHYISLVSTASDGYTRAYLDGRLQSSTSKTYSTMTLDDLYIGSQVGGGYDLTGTIDELRIYNYARSAGQITQDLNGGHPIGGSPIASQVGYYKLDEGYGTVTHNAGNAGSSINATLYSMSSPATSVSGWSNDGVFAKALAFDGTDDYVETAANAAVNITGDLTISAWIKPTSLSLGHKGLVNKRTTNVASPYVFDINNAQLYYQYYGADNSWHTYTSNNCLTTSWQYIAVVYDNSNNTATFYRNGIPCGSTQSTASTPYTGNSQGVRIGNDPGWGYFTGSIDEVKIYSAALSSSEIKIDYNNGAALTLGASSNTSGLNGGSIASNSASSAYCVPGDTATCSGPIGEWKMDEFSGTTIHDTSGNGHDGTFGSSTAAPTWTQGKVGNAVQFDGTNDYIDTGDKFATDTVTVEAWVYPTKSGGAQAVVDNARDCCGTYNGYGLETSYTGNNAQFKIWKSDGSSSVAAGGANVDLNAWNFLVGTFDGSSIKFYKNGKLVGTTTTYSGTLGTPSFNVRIGSHGSGCCFFGGKIDNVRIFNYARTGSQIAWDYNQGKPMVSYDFDECSGTTLHDLMYNANGTITIGGSGTQTSVGTCNTASTAWGNGASGKFNNSLYFDGTDDYVSFTSTNVITPTAGSVTVWAKPNGSQSSPAYIFSHPGTGDNSRVYLNFASGGYGVRCGLGNNTTIGTYTMSDGVWANLVCTWNGTTGAFYVNGVNKTTTPTFNGLTSATTTSYIGSFSGASQLFTGQIDDLKIFNFALTKQQVQTVFNQGGAVRFGP